VNLSKSVVLYVGAKFFVVAIIEKVDAIPFIVAGVECARGRDCVCVVGSGTDIIFDADNLSAAIEVDSESKAAIGVFIVGIDMNSIGGDVIVVAMVAGEMYWY